MAHPAYYVGSTGPIGLLSVAGLGYLAYRLGKKSGAEGDGNKSTLDQAFKGAIKAVYRAKMAVEESLEERKKRFSELWDEALTEAKK